jgi:hypothetical protein
MKTQQMVTVSAGFTYFQLDVFCRNPKNQGTYFLLISGQRIWCRQNFQLDSTQPKIFPAET